MHQHQSANNTASQPSQRLYAQAGQVGAAGTAHPKTNHAVDHGGQAAIQADLHWDDESDEIPW